MPPQVCPMVNHGSSPTSMQINLASVSQDAPERRSGLGQAPHSLFSRAQTNDPRAELKREAAKQTNLQDIVSTPPEFDRRKAIDWQGKK